MIFNVIFISKTFSQDVNDKVSIEHPHLYKPGQQNKFFSKPLFFLVIMKSTIYSVVIFFTTYGAMSAGIFTHPTTGQDAGYQVMSCCLATSLIFVVTLQIALETQYWTALNHFFLWGSLVMFFLFLFTMYSNTLFDILPNTFFFIGAARFSFSMTQLWLVTALSTVVCILPELFIRCWKQAKKRPEHIKARRKYQQFKRSPTKYQKDEETSFKFERGTHLQRSLSRREYQRKEEILKGPIGTNGEIHGTYRCLDDNDISQVESSFAFSGGGGFGKMIKDGEIRRSIRTKNNRR